MSSAGGEGGAGGAGGGDAHDPYDADIARVDANADWVKERLTTLKTLQSQLDEEQAKNLLLQSQLDEEQAKTLLLVRKLKCLQDSLKRARNVIDQVRPGEGVINLCNSDDEELGKAAGASSGSRALQQPSPPPPDNGDTESEEEPANGAAGGPAKRARVEGPKQRFGTEAECKAALEELCTFWSGTFIDDGPWGCKLKRSTYIDGIATMLDYTPRNYTILQQFVRMWSNVGKKATARNFLQMLLLAVNTHRANKKQKPMWAQNCPSGQNCKAYTIGPILWSTEDAEGNLHPGCQRIQKVFKAIHAGAASLEEFEQ
jgi:hypothetical protein